MSDDKQQSGSSGSRSQPHAPGLNSRSRSRQSGLHSRSRPSWSRSPSHLSAKIEGAEKSRSVRIVRSRSPVHSRMQQRSSHRGIARRRSPTSIGHVNDDMRNNPPENKVLAVFGLDNRVTEVALRDTFGPYGRNECKLIINKQVSLFALFLFLVLFIDVRRVKTRIYFYSFNCYLKKKKKKRGRKGLCLFLYTCV